jgi:hypothetical protein
MPLLHDLDWVDVPLRPQPSRPVPVADAGPDGRASTGSSVRPWRRPIQALAIGVTLAVVAGVVRRRR